ncbi:OmpA/MotB domain-containing protein [Candidatus Omnitrophus magneticus]|uniref:OmpA/MotB domain-containing protein n=1 Tax=Candidatus Omnitrophus magneticus TaxID=1609969 RepID=A0A0F0CN33_9BACT|nr:OmpA/MotB domain-containing protein [Candidatus Omnitrophus magneticus]
MKKILFAILFLTIIASACWASVDGDYEVAILNVKGTVKVDENGNNNWIPATTGMRLKKNAGIMTEKGAKADIVYDAEGLNIVTIKENSKITIAEAMTLLQDGSVFVKFDNLQKGSTFKVKTPNAVCAIRGSGMGVDYLQGMTIVVAYEHNVYVKGIDPATGREVTQEVTIPQGWKETIQAGITPEPPVELTENEQKIWDAWVEVVAQTTENKEESTTEKKEETKKEELQNLNENIDNQTGIVDTKDIDQKQTISNER